MCKQLITGDASFDVSGLNKLLLASSCIKNATLEEGEEPVVYDGTPGKLRAQTALEFGSVCKTTALSRSGPGSTRGTSSINVESVVRAWYCGSDAASPRQGGCTIMKFPSCTQNVSEACLSTVAGMSIDLATVFNHKCSCNVFIIEEGAYWGGLCPANACNRYLAVLTGTIAVICFPFDSSNYKLNVDMLVTSSDVAYFSELPSSKRPQTFVLRAGDVLLLRSGVCANVMGEIDTIVLSGTFHDLNDTSRVVSVLDTIDSISKDSLKDKIKE